MRKTGPSRGIPAYGITHCYLQPGRGGIASPSVCLLFPLFNQLTFDLDFVRIWVIITAHVGLKFKVIGHGVLKASTDGRIAVGYHCSDIISCYPARQPVSTRESSAL